MKPTDWLQLLAYFAALLALTPLLGGWMARVFAGERHALSALTAPVERLVFRAGGVDPAAEMTWRGYAGAVLAFNLLGMLAVLALQLTQARVPGNPQGLPNVPFALALNTAVSFMTNTNWQAYSGEATMTYTTQVAGLAVQNFVSAATGIAVLLALTRGLARKSSATIGNFWADLTRGTVSVLLPLSLVLAVVLVSQGVVQTFAPYAHATTLDGAEQIIPLGPAASQIAIKQIGTNGGGFFGVNSAHPFENPTPLSNFLQVLAILALPAALTFTYGRLVGDARQGWVLFGAMLLLFVAGLGLSLAAEWQSNPVTGFAGALEGKETRFGVMNSVLWASATTCASNGSVNAMHDSLSPLAGGVVLFNILLGEVVFGGVGAGLYGMLMFVLVTVFLCGLMVGRTPEYLGKKIEAAEVRWAMVAVLAPCALILIGACAAISTPLGTAALNNAGPHGLSEILYAYASAAGNNGSAFAGLGVNTDFYNYTLAAAMLLGRFGVILPALAIAGSLAAKKSAPPSPGTFPTHGATFGLLLVAVILIVGALTFFPVLSLGPVAEHFLMQQGRTF